MEFIYYHDSLIELCIFALLLAFVMLFFRQFKTVKSMKKTNELKVRQLYPELSDIDLKYRKTNIVNYTRYYLYSPQQRTLLTIAILISTIGIFVALYNVIFTNKSYISFFILALTYYCRYIVQFAMPNVEKQFKFWNQYLVYNPENTLKVVLNTKQNAKLLVQENNKLLNYGLIIATLVLLLGIVSYIRFHYPFS